jgi:hypothetical protein
MPDLSMPSMPSMSDFSLKPGSYGSQQVTLAVESDPPGAEARASNGGSCRTPCALALTASNDFTVSVSLNGYLPQSVPVKLIPPEDPRFAGEGSAPGARVDPNPIFVELEKAPPPAAPAKKKPPARKPVARAKPVAAPPTAYSEQPPAPAPMAPSPSAIPSATNNTATAPWPMPR